MRLLTGVMTDSDGFYMHSPSEPILMMGSIDILYNTEEQGIYGTFWTPWVKTYSSQDSSKRAFWVNFVRIHFSSLCMTLPPHSILHGKVGISWSLSLWWDSLIHFSENTYSTLPIDQSLRIPLMTCMWILHIGSAPRAPSLRWTSKLPLLCVDPLIHMHAGNYLQTYGLVAQHFSVAFERIDLLIPVYHGFVNPDSIFDPSLLSLTVVQVKFKTGGDLDTELAISPIGVVCNLDKPLPYLVIVMELGCKWHYKGNIKFLASKPPTDCYSCSTDSRSMHTWYIGQAHLFSPYSNLAMPLFPDGMPLFYICLQMSLFLLTTHLYSNIYDAFIISTYDLSLSTNTYNPCSQ